MVRTREFSRLDRVASTVKKSLAEPISELARARAAGLATITGVELSPDLRHGTVYLSVYGEIADKHEFLRYVSERAGALQAILSHCLRTRRLPVLRFKLDDSLERVERIHALLRRSAAKGAGH